MPELTEWNNFYVIVGSSAGALIGLQFVVIALIAETPRARATAQAGAAFSTPSVVHFAVVLLLSAVNAAPWKRTGGIALFWGVLGVAGIVYSLIVARRLHQQTAYKPVFEDWLFHLVLPLAAYATLVAAAFAINSAVRVALFIPGAAVLLLLFAGIHNAWDAATYHIFVSRRGARKDKEGESEPVKNAPE
jgi:hypothetical protein